MFYCVDCGAKNIKPLPVDPIYPVADVCEILCMPRNTLNRFLTAHKAELAEINPPLYKRQKNTSHKRYLSASEVRFIRNRMLRSNESDTSRRKMTLEELLGV